MKGSSLKEVMKKMSNKDILSDLRLVREQGRPKTEQIHKNLLAEIRRRRKAKGLMRKSAGKRKKLHPLEEMTMSNFEKDMLRIGNI